MLCKMNQDYSWFRPFKNGVLTISASIGQHKDIEAIKVLLTVPSSPTCHM